MTLVARVRRWPSRRAAGTACSPSSPWLAGAGGRVGHGGAHARPCCLGAAAPQPQTQPSTVAWKLPAPASRQAMRAAGLDAPAGWWCVLVGWAARCPGRCSARSSASWRPSRTRRGRGPGQRPGRIGTLATPKPLREGRSSGRRGLSRVRPDLRHHRQPDGGAGSIFFRTTPWERKRTTHGRLARG